MDVYKLKYLDYFEYIMKKLLIIILMTLTACATDSEPNIKPSLNSNQCTTGITAKINAKPIIVNAPNPFDGMVNPGMNVFNEQLNIGLLTKEIGLFELLDFSIKDLHVGNYSGDKFTLNLIRQNKICKHNQQTSKFIIKQYDTTDGSLNGCLFGKFNCDNEIIEITANISGTVY
jgi:hypothetical protein